MKIIFSILDFGFAIGKPRRPRRPASITNRKSQIVNSGFTLIEIMVAIVIFAMLVSAVYATWVLILKSSRIAQEAAAQVQRQRVAIRTIEDSLTCIQSFQASMQYYTFEVDNGDKPTLSFVSRVPDIFPRNGRFGDFNLRRLTFTVEPATASGGSDAENDLVLRQNPMLMDMDPDEQATPLVLARNVKKFAVDCWDTNKLDWSDEWLDTNSIPPMIRIQLTLGGNLTDTGATAPTLDITREIAVPSGTLPSAAQTGSGLPVNGANVPRIKPSIPPIIQH
jgi:prepilin-type N-terminal cleavage/methylation domain-containing protein